jgi:4-alpha-glucanotransferase
MSVFFRLHYRTVWGEQLAVQYLADQDATAMLFPLQTYDGETWTGELTAPLPLDFHYKYVLLRDGHVVLTEWGEERQVKIQSNVRMVLADSWRPRAVESNVFLSSAFTQSIFARKSSKGSKSNSKKKQTSESTLVFRLRKADVLPSYCCGITGNIPQLGGWKKAILMDDTGFPLWECSLKLPSEKILIEYKYVVCDAQSGEIIEWEAGENRKFLAGTGGTKQEVIVLTEENTHEAKGPWRGAGVAIPVFSLRSEQGMGIGEFADLKPLADWAAKTRLAVIQVLPVNDTLATKTWTDSYPYAAISVFALHPLYIRIDEIGPLPKKSDVLAYKEMQTSLNLLEEVDFEKVLSAKMHFLRILFTQQRAHFTADKEAQDFITSNAHWLKPYAVFCHLRDKYNTCNFNQWPTWSSYSERAVNELADSGYEAFEEVQFWYFVQYHADKQLASAREYARQHGVVLKGDLPIGIYRHSCDAWVAPALYNMKEQAGAPPDDYAVDGQNWGFPTYNWQIMAQDGFGWWKMRMQQLNRYFDALRIDHILGFFRIWQIPTAQISGTLGMFNPRLPFAEQDLRHFGLQGDLIKYTQPNFSKGYISSLFGPDTDEICHVFFRQTESGDFVFRSAFPDQQTIHHFCAQNTEFKRFEVSLLKLKTEVLLLEEPESNGRFFNPRITLQTTHRYQQLSYDEKMAFDRLYNEYYFSRHNVFWQEQALWKLPAILDASNMLICGEDLGMIPATVPGVMRDMNIISLEIQRMPKGHGRFGIVSEYPYFSVCSPSCHDMSTIRGWWESDYQLASSFYHDYLHWYGQAPETCEPTIVQAIVEDHLASPSMLAIFPLQDLVGMVGELRKENAASEQINEPSNPRHYWKFRFHIPMEKLLDDEDFNGKVRRLVQHYGR